MATGTLTGQTIANTYKSLLKVTGTTAGGETLHATTLKVIEDGDGNPTPIQLAQNRIEIVPTANHANAFEVSQADGTQILNINSTTPTVSVGVDGTGADVVFYSGTAGDNFTWDASAEKLTITGTNGQTALDVADGNLVVADNIDLEGDIDVNGTANLDNTDIDGTFTQDAGNVVFNEDSGDYDFRVESNGNANMLFVDGGNNGIGIGTSTPTGQDTRVNSDGTILSILGATGSVLELTRDTTTNDHWLGALKFMNLNNSDASGATAHVTSVIYGAVETDDTNTHTDSGGYLVFQTKPNEGSLAQRMIIGSDGTITVSAGDLIMGTSGKGISFAATSDGTTMSSEILDDYEEGIHTAVAAYTGAGSPTIKTANDQLQYTKIGRLVTVTGYLQMNANGSGGNWTISLPFAVGTGDDQGLASPPSLQINSVDASNAWQGSCWEGESVVYIQEFDGTTNQAGGAKVNDGSTVMLSLTYTTA